MPLAMAAKRKQLAIISIVQAWAERFYIDIFHELLDHCPAVSITSY